MSTNEFPTETEWVINITESMPLCRFDYLFHRYQNGSPNHQAIVRNLVWCVCSNAHFCRWCYDARYLWRLRAV